MQLLYPIGLLALAGLIIPVVIHLWSVKKGKTLKIGSIYLLGESANATSKSLKITDWLLFVMRCLLLIIVSLLLAQPFLQKRFKTNSEMGWILVDQNQFTSVYSTHKKTIDSLLNLGIEMHDFNFGFNQFVLKDSLQKTKKSTLSNPSLFKKLNNFIPKGYTAYLFAPKKIADYEGDLPKINYKLNWVEIQITDTIKTWATKFLGKNYEAKSTPNVTIYSSETNQNLPALRVMIFEPKGNDSKYVKAALSAITDYAKRKIVFQDFNADSPADITFWFASEKIPSSYLAKLKPSAKLFFYINGKANAVNSTVQLNNSETNHIDLYQRIESDIQQGEVIWKDGFGEPLLIKQQNNEISSYYFYSKFNPQWTDLVWNEQFVSALMPIVLGNQNAADFGFENNENDQRIIASNQSLFISKNVINAVSRNVEKIVLTNYLWFLALLILIVERILSFRKTKISHV